jgi:hypothetical protein
VKSRFFRKDGKFFVETGGPDGTLAAFEMKYTFGIDPLQQYLIEFPDGRVQALSLAWDSRPKEQGGQYWFHLYPNEDIEHDDILDWTKLNQNWNFMCAECHSTGVRKNYDAVAADGNAPAFARASALTDLARSVSPKNGNLVRVGLSDLDPMVRLGVLDMLESVPVTQIWPLASQLLSDPSRGIRIKGGIAARRGSGGKPATRRPRGIRDRWTE